MEEEAKGKKREIGRRDKGEEREKDGEKRVERAETVYVLENWKLFEGGLLGQGVSMVWDGDGDGIG